MKTSLLGLWEKVLKLLQDRTLDLDPADIPQYHSVRDLVDKLRNMPPPPKSTWKKLVQQLQVRTSTTHSLAASLAPTLLLALWPKTLIMLLVGWSIMDMLPFQASCQ